MPSDRVVQSIYVYHGDKFFSVVRDDLVAVEQEYIIEAA